jgi:hypothetical protein
VRNTRQSVAIHTVIIKGMIMLTIRSDGLKTKHEVTYYYSIMSFSINTSTTGLNIAVVYDYEYYCIPIVGYSSPSLSLGEHGSMADLRAWHVGVPVQP